jgi:oligosaccharyltransferase complex subunit delta (ribophorin II)
MEVFTLSFLVCSPKCDCVDCSALLVSGAYKLADTVNKPPPITGDQAVKFANYFLSRRSVQTAKGAYSLLEVVHTLTDNKVLSVLCSST